MEQIIAATIYRRKIAIALFLIIKALQQRRRNQYRRRLWSRQWLQRRNTRDNVLSMLFTELR